MAVLKIVAVFDRAVQAFSRPAFVGHLGSAIRSFEDESKRPESEIYKHPADYSLCHLGEFDDETGRFVSVSPVELAKAVNFLKGDKDVSQ